MEDDGLGMIVVCGFAAVCFLCIFLLPVGVVLMKYRKNACKNIPKEENIDYSAYKRHKLTKDLASGIV